MSSEYNPAEQAAAKQYGDLSQAVIGAEIALHFVNGSAVGFNGDVVLMILVYQASQNILPVTVGSFAMKLDAAKLLLKGLEQAIATIENKPSS